MFPEITQYLRGLSESPLSAALALLLCIFICGWLLHLTVFLQKLGVCKKRVPCRRLALDTASPGNQRVRIPVALPGPVYKNSRNSR